MIGYRASKWGFVVESGRVVAPAGTRQRLQWHHCSAGCYNTGETVQVLNSKDGGFWGFSLEEIDFDFDGCVLEEQIRDVVGIEDVSCSEIAGASLGDGDCYSDEISEAIFEEYLYRVAPPPYTGGMENG